MKDESSYVVIGLGKFGLSVGETLMDEGKQVIGLDNRPGAVNHARDMLTQVYEVDATDMEALKQLGFENIKNVIVSVGQSMEASILICLHLKELNVPNLIVKAMSTDHEKILKRLDVNEIIFPEQIAAKECARRLVVPGLIDELPSMPDIILQKLTVNKWAGKKLRDIDMINRYGVQVVAYKKVAQETYQYVPRGDQILERNDSLFVIGNQSKTQQLMDDA